LPRKGAGKANFKKSGTGGKSGFCGAYERLPLTQKKPTAAGLQFKPHSGFGGLSGSRRVAVPHIATLLTYAAVVLGLFLIPGPAVLLVLARASAGGRRVGIATGMGIATGDLVHTAMATLGLSAVLMTSALAFSLVKYAGAAYLIYLGVRALLERGADLRLGSARLIDAPLAYRQGVLAEMLNPKTALFFLAFLPQFVHPEQGSVVLQLAVLGFIFVAMSAIYTAVIAVAAGYVAGLLARHRGVGRWQGRVIGAIYVGLGVRLALQER
jgi:threonine/homoserine/homoserine lactone efflux protein